MEGRRNKPNCEHNGIKKYIRTLSNNRDLCKCLQCGEPIIQGIEKIVNKPTLLVRS